MLEQKGNITPIAWNESGDVLVIHSGPTGCQQSWIALARITIMLGLILFALFLTAAVGIAVVLADSFVRGREAFARLRREMAQAEPVGCVYVTIEGPASDAALPDRRPRPVSRAGGRAPRQMPARAQRLLPAAA